MTRETISRVQEHSAADRRTLAQRDPGRRPPPPLDRPIAGPNASICFYRPRLGHGRRARPSAASASPRPGAEIDPNYAAARAYGGGALLAGDPRMDEFTDREMSRAAAEAQKGYRSAQRPTDTRDWPVFWRVPKDEAQNALKRAIEINPRADANAWRWGSVQSSRPDDGATNAATGAEARPVTSRTTIDLAVPTICAPAEDALRNPENARRATRISDVQHSRSRSEPSSPQEQAPATSSDPPPLRSLRSERGSPARIPITTRIPAGGRKRRM